MTGIRRVEYAKAPHSASSKAAGASACSSSERVILRFRQVTVRPMFPDRQRSKFCHRMLRSEGGTSPNILPHRRHEESRAMVYGIRWKIAIQSKVESLNLPILHWPPGSTHTQAEFPTPLQSRLGLQHDVLGRWGRSSSEKSFSAGVANCQRVFENQEGTVPGQHRGTLRPV